MKKVKSKNRRLKNRCSKNNRLKKSRQKNKRKNRQPKSEQAKNNQPENKQQKYGQPESSQSENNQPESKQQKCEQTESSQSKNNQPQKLKKRGTAQKIFTAVGIALCVFLIPIVISNLILSIKGYTNKDEVPSLFSILPMYVITDSMVPTIDSGDLIFVKKITPTDIAVDDIIAFFDPESMKDTMIIHRVKEISTDGDGNLTFRTKGDANNVYDTFIITGENLVGRYVFRLRGLGSVAMFMQTPYGLIITISIPLLMLFVYEIIYQLISIKKDRDNDKKADIEKEPE